MSSLYYIKITTQANEVFYKIGVTSDIAHRFAKYTAINNVNKVDIELLYSHQSDDALAIEQALLRRFKAFVTTKDVLFHTNGESHGNSEVFVSDIVEMHGTVILTSSYYEVDELLNPTQLAIKAWKLWRAGTYTTMSEASKAVGVSLKQVQRINIIGGANEPLPAKQYQRFNRIDIIEQLFNGGKILLEGFKPTDSPQTIINTLEKTSRLDTNYTPIPMPTEELTLDETNWVSMMVEAYSKQSAIVRSELLRKLEHNLSQH